MRDLMLSSRSLQVLVASVLARAPNFLLPVLAIRVLDFSSYSVFAIGFAAAASMSSFLGEAIAATISRESFRATQNAEGSSSLSAFFRLSFSSAYLLIIALVSIYWLSSTDAGDDGGRAWLAAVATILLTPAYLLPAAVTALANAHGRGNVSTAASLVGVPVAITFSLLIGAEFGVIYFLLSYFFFVVLTNSIVCFRVSSVFRLDDSQGLTVLCREYGAILLAVLIPFLLGGPVHGFCLYILGQGAGGSTELPRFVAYYPWSTAVSVFAAVLANYVIQTIVEIRKQDDARALRKFTGRLLTISFVVATSVSGVLWSGMDFVLMLYGPDFPRSENLFAWMLICGVGSSIVSTTSQILIGFGSRRGLLSCAVLHAVLYIGLCLVLIGEMELGAEGVARSLSYSLFVLAFFHLVLIGRHVRFSGHLSAARLKVPG